MLLFFLIFPFNIEIFFGRSGRFSNLSHKSRLMAFCFFVYVSKSVTILSLHEWKDIWSKIKPEDRNNPNQLANLQSTWDFLVQQCLRVYHQCIYQYCPTPSSVADLLSILSSEGKDESSAKQLLKISDRLLMLSGD